MLADIRAIERLQDEDILMAGVDYSATRRYAELLLAALTAWNAKHRIYLLTEELEAVERWRARAEQGHPGESHEPALDKFTYLVWGTQGYGLIAETGDCLGDYPISFWNRPETEELVGAICLEATAMAAHIQASGPSDEWVLVARMGGAEAALVGELDENFSRLSRKAREAVEREARQVMSAPTPAKPAETAVHAEAKPKIINAAAVRVVRPKETTITMNVPCPVGKPGTVAKEAAESFPPRREVYDSAIEEARTIYRNMGGKATWEEACRKAYGKYRREIEHHSLFREKDGGGFSVGAMIAAIKRHNKARQEKARIASRVAPVPVSPRAR